MIARHFCAYNFARPYAAGKEVLDIGCGEGYGSFYLAQTAGVVTGIDYDQEVVAYAKEKYPRLNLEFLVLDVNYLGELRRKFDTICSFQNIEHIRDDRALLSNIAKLLKAGGNFICSTCNRLDASPGKTTPSNRFHVREYLSEEFKALLSSVFPVVKVFGLKRGGRMNFYRRLKKSGVCNFLPPKMNPVKRFYRDVGTEDFVLTEKGLDTALDFIAVCRKD